MLCRCDLGRSVPFVMYAFASLEVRCNASSGRRSNKDCSPTMCKTTRRGAAIAGRVFMPRPIQPVLSVR